MTEANGAGWLVSDRARRALDELDRVLRQAVAPGDLQLRMMVHHLLDQGGKRLRPALVLLAGELGDARREELLPAAAGLELLHVASLYHDDVMDRAPLRRNVPSANARWGNGAAAIAGTYLFAKATTLFAGLGDAPNRLAAAAIADVCAGQLQEVENAFNLDLGEDEHLQILERKTAALFVLPVRLGAELAEAPDGVAAALAEYGRNLGLAFQLADDALDLGGESAELGKATGTDLLEGVYSLSVLRLLRRGDGVSTALRLLLAQARPTPADAREAVRLVASSGEVERSLETAREFADAARAALAALPDGDVAESLDRLAGYAVSRSR